VPAAPAPTGRAFDIDILARTRELRVTEVPFPFPKRINDKSKVTVEQGMAFPGYLGFLKRQDYSHRFISVEKYRKCFFSREELRNWTPPPAEELF
jgi:hypothetical protein